MKSIPIILGAFTITMCLVFSYFLIFTGLFSDRAVGNKRTLLIIIMLGYAAFRGIRMIQYIKQNKQNNEL